MSAELNTVLSAATAGIFYLRLCKRCPTDNPTCCLFIVKRFVATWYRQRPHYKRTQALLKANPRRSWVVIQLRSLLARQLAEHEQPDTIARVHAAQCSIDWRCFSSSARNAFSILSLLPPLEAVLVLGVLPRHVNRNPLIATSSSAQSRTMSSTLKSTTSFLGFEGQHQAVPFA